MKRDALPELRILSGLHAGARAPLGAGPQVLGSGADCDFVLADEGIAPQHLRLEPQADGSVLLHWLDGSREPLRLAAGEGAQVGPVTLAVDQEQAPWPQDPARVMVAAVAPPPAGPEVVAAATDAAVAAAAQPEALPVAAIDPAEPQLSAPAAPRKLPWLPLLVALLGLASIILVWSVLASAPKQLPQPQAVAPALPPGDQRARIEAIAHRLGLVDRLQVEQLPGGELRVRVAFVSDAEAEALASALSALSPRPGLSLQTETELLQAIRDAVDEQAARLDTALAARHLGAGVFRIEGRIADDQQRQQVLAALQAGFPLVARFEDGLRTPAQMADAMIAELQDAGVGEVDGIWRDGKLQLRARLAHEQLPLWEHALAQAAARHPLPWHAEVEFIGPARSPAPAGGNLPFAVRSIVGGATPYVVLADGRKLVLEGRLDGWTLVALSDSAAVFEGPGGRRVALQR